MELHGPGAFSGALLHTGREASAMKLLDTVAVKLAGGSHEDVRHLDEFSYSDLNRKTSDASSNLESGFLRSPSKSGPIETVVAIDNAK
ncbi:hypothetical protein FBUS_11354 [Fasciolopsis buskii]|uniref:Uncharacterized protein n=1 Tax=Fasciolopsis buskii TaxID=27845 RepID=A0A8E0VI81_9TREM|nr:hypothetical protein FBUS_11354 [Fasciolopsis buski]